MLKQLLGCLVLMLFSTTQIVLAQSEPMPKNLTPDADIPMAAPDVPMAAPDVPMHGAPVTPSSSKMININQLPEVEKPPAAATHQPIELQPPINLERKPLPSGRFIEVTELPPTEPDENTAEEGNPFIPAEVPVLPDPNAPEDLSQLPHENYEYVTLFGINKIAARSEEIKGNTGEVIRYKNLEIIAHKCQSIVDNGEQGVAAILQIMELKPGHDASNIFQGWMFSTSPSLSNLEHPLYDVGLKACSHGDKKVEKPTEAEKETKKPDSKKK